MLLNVKKIELEIFKKRKENSNVFFALTPQ